ncbi:hypothetical protein CDL12_04407 [Handroanthus impetiginosus]|uniref:Uncharacterized protein n=1 Tax=Handroanthus impetiginosus TaxID=429701 RepID=A0A2G9HZE5_9LAMI|nr:hypothetical protein CDL12_04407 [Handroanthus impetiginosus]
MADSVEGAGFWLPSEFFDDFLMDKQNLNKTYSAESHSEFCFPTEFPYDFETETDEHLGKRWVLSTSPQSTLAHLGSWSGRSAGGSSNGSPNGVPSPPTSPFGAKNDAVEDLIYRAAGQVAKLKLNGGEGFGPTKNKGLLGPPESLEQFYPAVKNPNPSVFQGIYSRQHMVKQQKQGSGMWYTEPQMYQVRAGRAAGGMGQDAWPIQQNPSRIVGSAPRAVLMGGSGGGVGGGGAAVKRGCAGTGVFLPRRYVNNNECNAYSSDSHKKPGYSSGNVHALNRNLDNMNVFPQPQSQCQPKFNRGFVPEYDLLMARRNAAIMLQHRRNLLLEGRNLLLDGSSPALAHRGIYLPQDWTY